MKDSDPSPDTQPPALEPAASVSQADALYRGYVVLLLLFVAVVSALRWSWYPIFVDTYYHMAVIQGMHQAGGLPTWAFWELAPAGRVHIYPPSLHILGFLGTFMGLAPVAFITLVSWLFYPAMFLTTWWWLDRVFGARTALAALILLAGPTALFWNQTTFTGVALVLTVAPLALLALEKERFLACAVCTLVATAAHPMGLFLPPALVINTLLRRKRRRSGLAAAILPAVLYLPWLAHVWANRAYMPAERTGGEISLGGIGAGSDLNLGLALGVAALMGIVWILVRRRQTLGLLGPVLGFAVVFAMGFGGRFLQFNIHWPLACLGGLGVGLTLETIERCRPRVRRLLGVVVVGLAFLSLATSAALELQLPKERGPERSRRADPAGNARAESAPTRPGWSASLAMGPSALAKLLDPASSPMEFASLGRRQNRNRMGNVLRGDAAPPRLPGGFRNPPGFRLPDGPQPGGNVPTPMGVPGGLGGGRRGPGGPGGMDMLNQEGADAFFAAVEERVQTGEVVYLRNAVAGSLVTGVTGRWTSSGILRDVRSGGDRAGPEDCHFYASVAGGSPGFGSAGEAPDGFREVFANDFGTLWKNGTDLPLLDVHPAEVPFGALVLLAALGVVLITADLALPRDRVRARWAVGTIGLLMAAGCLVPLTLKAVDELRHPPEAGPPPEESLLGLPPPFPGAPGAGPAGPGLPPEIPPVPAGLQERYDRIHAALREHLEQGKDPRFFWAPADEMRLRRLIELDETTEAGSLLDAALARLEQGEETAR